MRFASVVELRKKRLVAAWGGKHPGWIDEAIPEGLVALFLLWDVEDFYNSIDILKLVDRALALDFPPAQLASELLVQVGLRVLKCPGLGYGPVAHPQVSLVAGLRSAVDMSRCILHEILEKVSSR